MSDRKDAALLDALLRMLQARKVPAVEVTGYAEASWNVGYCETCSECITGVRVFYRTEDGSTRAWDHEWSDLGELIRELTDDAAERTALVAVADRQPDDLKWERYGEAHSLGEALEITEVEAG